MANNDNPYWLVICLDTIFPWQRYRKYYRFWGYNFFFFFFWKMYDCNVTIVMHDVMMLLSRYIFIQWHHHVLNHIRPVLYTESIKYICIVTLTWHYVRYALLITKWWMNFTNKIILQVIISSKYMYMPNIMYNGTNNKFLEAKNNPPNDLTFNIGSSAIPPIYMGVQVTK